jgi:hypothetical protein
MQQEMECAEDSKREALMRRDFLEGGGQSPYAMIKGSGWSA